MNIIVACEESGTTREALRKQGHEAYSADLQESSLPSGAHYQGDCLPLLYPVLRDLLLGHIGEEECRSRINAGHYMTPERHNDSVRRALHRSVDRWVGNPRQLTEREAAILLIKWDGLIGHPDCTFLTVTGNRWNKPEYAERFPNRPEQRQAAIDFFMALVAADVPNHCIEQPRSIMATIYRKPDQWVQPFYFGHPEPKQSFYWLKGLPHLAATKMVEPEYHTTKSGKRVPRWFFFAAKKDRAKIRSKSFQGIADAMATQWFN